MSAEAETLDLVPPELPSSAELIRRGREIARALTVGTTRYQRRYDARSERFYKERCRDERIITYYINLGLKNWAETRDALRWIQAECERRRLRVDRVSLTADRRMGLPPASREAAHEETGIMFWTPEDWSGVGHEIELQGILNDHAVGSPASVVNAEAAIEAGISYIGNLSQQNYGYPGWTDDVAQMANTVVAISMLAEKKGDGVVLDSYIDDGYCASFHDAATSLGWCLFHHYVARDIIGAAHTPSFGSTFSDPLLKAAFGIALDRINVDRVPPSLVHGDTNSLRPDDSVDRSSATVATDVFFTVARELTFPTGAAVHATPLSEPVRIPTPEDIVQSLEIGNEAERRARASLGLIDWRPALELADRIVAGGQRVFALLLEGLASFGVDTRDPLQLLVATRRLGAARIEELYGAGEPDRSYPRGFRPIAETDTYRRSVEHLRNVLDALTENGSRPDLRGIRIVAASGDIHEYGLYVLVNVLRELGAEVVDLGTSVDPELLVQAASEAASDGVALSTYNGMALSLGREVEEALRRRRLPAQFFIGGRLTEDIGSEKSVDVSGELERVGAIPCLSVEDMVYRLKRPNDNVQEKGAEGEHGG
jgi:methylmalonyl-CoA mutase cobalamin-binding subunit